MPQRFDGVLRVQGTWRDYQQRVLDHASRYLADGKLHIVAAPGVIWWNADQDGACGWDD